MSREKRAIDPEWIYHVVCRGSNRGEIVWDSVDCESFRSELDRVATKFEWDVYAWCLMPNHHHIVLQTTKERFSAGFQQLNGNHSRRTNRRHGRSDHLFRNRPRAFELASTAHFVGAVAYVVRNPVTAKIVDHAAEWPWSSYRATVGLEPAPAWLRSEKVINFFGRDPKRAVAEFEHLVHIGHLPVSDTEEELSQEIAVPGGVVLMNV